MTPLLRVLFEPVTLDIKHLEKSQEPLSKKVCQAQRDLVVDDNRFTAPHLEAAWPWHAENLAGHLRLRHLPHNLSSESTTVSGVRYHR